MTTSPREPCAICGRPVARGNVRTPEAYRSLCAGCRDNAASRRAKAGLFPEEAVAVVAAAYAARTERPAPCALPGCLAPAGRAYRNTPTAHRGLCMAHRERAQQLVARGRADRADVLAALARIVPRPGAGRAMPVTPAPRSLAVA